MPKRHTHLTSPRLALARLRELRDLTDLCDGQVDEKTRAKVKASFILWWDCHVVACLTTLERRHSKTRVKK
jgi:hypothetical protein